MTSSSHPHFFDHLSIWFGLDKRLLYSMNKENSLKSEKSKRRVVGVHTTQERM